MAERQKFMQGFARGAVTGLCLAAAALVQAQPSASPSLGSGPWVFNTYEQQNMQVSVLARGLEHPFGLVFIPGTASEGNPLGDVLINERSGKVRLYRNGALLDAAVVDLSSVFPLRQLFDIELHPAFADNGLVYFTWIKQLPHPDG